MTHTGACPALVFDDNKYWAVSFTGCQPCIAGDDHFNEPVEFGVGIEPEDWKPSIREAIDWAFSKEVKP
jgi:hypothetical protein